MNESPTPIPVPMAAVLSAPHLTARYRSELTDLTRGGADPLLSLPVSDILTLLNEIDSLRISLDRMDLVLETAAYQVDSRHHLNGTSCLCGFKGDARSRTQTEHITARLVAAARTLLRD